MMYTRRVAVDVVGGVSISHIVTEDGTERVVSRQAWQKARASGKPWRVLVVVPEEVVAMTVSSRPGAPSSVAGRTGRGVGRQGGEVR